MTAEQALRGRGRLCSCSRQVSNPSCIRKTNPFNSKSVQPSNTISTGTLSRNFQGLYPVHDHFV
jgi:hypothetical protein